MKILVLRFSSIGDIVLTTSVIRCMKNQLKDIEIHYLTKSKFKTILENNPNITKLHHFEKSINEVIGNLNTEKFDCIIDLHNNIRTLSLKIKLGVKSYSFPKLNFKKWLLVKFKINKMPKIHIVNRYFETVKKLAVINDYKNCEYYIPKQDEINIFETFGIQHFVSFAIGAQFATKRLPLNKIYEIIAKIEVPLVLLGDKNDELIANQITLKFPEKKILNACGKFSLNQSASIVKQSKVLLTHDTGLMHIASCFEKQIVSVWGNTVPDLGMYPYQPKKPENFSIHEVSNLKCRPCSKIGFQSCPKKHFSCMNLQDETKIALDITQRFDSLGLLKT